MTIVDTGPVVRLLEIFDGAKLIRSLNCTLKYKIFQHIIYGNSDSCIEIVAFLLFHDTTVNNKKVIQLERLFLSTKRVFSEIKKPFENVRVKITIDNVPFIADHICSRIHVSIDMQLQLMPFIIEKNGKRLESDFNVSFDGVKYLAQLPHIDNIKDETRRQCSGDKSEWDKKTESFSAEINACESALVAANLHMKNVSQAIQFFLHHFERGKSISVGGDEMLSMASQRWIIAMRKTILQNRVKKTVKHLEVIGYLLQPVIIEEIEAPPNDVQKGFTKLPSFSNVKFGTRHSSPASSAENSFIISEDDQPAPLMVHLRSTKSFSALVVRPVNKRESSGKIPMLDLDSMIPKVASSVPSTARTPLIKFQSIRNITQKEATDELENDPAVTEAIPSTAKPPLRKSPSFESPSNARPPLQKSLSKKKLLNKRSVILKALDSTEQSVAEISEGVLTATLSYMPFLKAIIETSLKDPTPTPSPSSGHSSHELIPIESPRSRSSTNDSSPRKSPRTRPRGDSSTSTLSTEHLPIRSPRSGSSSNTSSPWKSPTMSPSGDSSSPSVSPHELIPICSPRNVSTNHSSSKRNLVMSPRGESSPSYHELVPIGSPRNITHKINLLGGTK